MSSRNSLRDRRYRHESDPMLNSVLNGDWSNSVPGRQFPKGGTELLQSPFRMEFNNQHGIRGIITIPVALSPIPEVIGGSTATDAIRDSAGADADHCGTY